MIGKNSYFISMISLYACFFIILGLMIGSYQFFDGSIHHIPGIIIICFAMILLIGIIYYINLSYKNILEKLLIFSIFLVPFGDYIIIMLPFLLGGLLTDSEFRKNILRKFEPIDYAWCFFAGTAFISSIPAKDMTSGLAMSSAFLLYGFLFRCSRYTRLTPAFKNNLMLVFAYTMLCAVSFSIFHFLHNKPVSLGGLLIYSHGNPGMTSLLGGWPANAAGMLVMSFLILCYGLIQSFIKNQSKITKIILIISTSIVLLGTFLTETRMALLFLIGAGIILLLCYPSSQWRQLRFTLLLIPCIAVPILGIYSAKWEKTLTNPLKQATIADRLHQFQFGLETWSNKHIIIGIGSMNFRIYYEEFGDPLIQRLRPGHPRVEFLHNIYLSTLVENGILGFTAFLSAVGILWLSFWRNRKSYIGLFSLAFFTGILTVGLVDNWLYVLRFGILGFIILGFLYGENKQLNRF